jgi:hypothetical protein
VVAVIWTVLANADFAISKFASVEFQSKWNLWWHPNWSGQVWLVGLLVIALLMIWEGSYRHSSTLDAKIESLHAQLNEIENAKPRIMLCDPDARHVEPISFGAIGMLPFFAAPLVKVRFINKPQEPYTDKSVANGIVAKLRFFDSSSMCLLPMDGRWDDTDQPSDRPATQSKSDLLAVTFLVEGARNVDVAFWDAKKKIFVAFNNDSYNFPPTFTKPGHELGSGPIRAEIRLVGARVNEVFSLNFWMGQDGKVQVSL